MTEELCFHSFPRLRHGETIETAISKFTKIALSILNNGLLLAPENFEIPIRDSTGAKVDSLTVLQCRICFTLLSLRELRTHSQTFGPFSLAFEIDSLRQIGALTVHYVPSQQGSYLYGLSVEILSGVANAIRTLESLAKIQMQIEPSPTLGLVTYTEIDGQQVRDGVRMNEEQTTVLRSFFDEFESMCSVKLHSTHQKLFAASGCFYPTENPKHTGKLHYYHQREWRVSECGLEVDGLPLAPRATEIQKETLISIDDDFFARTICVPSSSGRVNEWESARLVDRCRFLSRIGDLNILTQAKMLVAPNEEFCNTSIAEAFRQLGIDVVTIDEVERQRHT